MAKQRKFKTPDFVEIFGEVRGDPTKHLNQRVSEGGEYLVPDSDIAGYAKAILASKFYCEPWMDGCQPATVLFEAVIKDLTSDNPKRVRKAVNKAYGAETRILAMGLDAYIAWRKAGVPVETKESKPASQAAPEPSAPTKKAGVINWSAKLAVPLPVLKAETASKLNGLLAKQHLLDQMPESVRDMAEEAKKAMNKGQLLQPTAEAVLVAVEQWLLLRKEHRVEAANQAALASVMSPALQQYDYLLNTFAGDERVVDHLEHLREALESGSAKAIASAIRVGDRLSGLLDGTIAPVVSIRPKEQTPTNLASTEYIRERLAAYIPERGRPVAGAGKGHKEKAKRKSG